MPYNPLRLGILSVIRLKPFTANEVGDGTAGGSNNIQQFMDARRSFLGNVANNTARDALTGVTSGQWVFNETGPSVDMWNGAAWVSLTGGGGAPTYNVNTVTSSPYTVLSSDDVVVCNLSTTGPFTIDLPTTPAANEQVRIKDGKGDAFTHNITINAGGSTTIDGAGSLPLDENFGSRTLIFDGTATWRVL